MGTTEVVSAGGIFPRLADIVVRWPLLVIGLWIATAATLALALPPLPVVAAKQQVNPLPDDAPTMVVNRQMQEAFQSTGASSILLIVLTDENGLTPADEATYAKLVVALHQDSQDSKEILGIQDVISTPPLRDVMVSKDNKAINLPISLAGDSAEPAVQAAYRNIGQIAKKTVAGTTLTAHVTGPVATFADITAMGEHDMHVIEIGTGLMVLTILLIIYRNAVTMFVPLATIGLSLGTAQGVLAGLGELGLGLSTQTLVLMVGVMVGAGTDYAVFLMSRYHDYVRHGSDSDYAVKMALASIGKVIAASAATVAVTFIAMVFCQLKVFALVGPAISIAILIAFLAAITLLPAVLVLIGRRGWIKPRRDLTTLFWRRSGTRIVRRPIIHLTASLIVLITLASCAGLVHFNYDDRKALPADQESSVGYAAMDRHFPQNAMTPQLLFIKSSHDLRNPQSLADLEQMASRVAQLPDISLVRGITRPMGDSLEQTKLSWQAGEVGGKLDDASTQIKDHNADLDLLANGANQLADALADVRGQVTGAVGSVSGLVDALTMMQAQFGGNKTLSELDNTAKLAGNMRMLGSALNANMGNVRDVVAFAAPLMASLNASPVCDGDPACRSSRAELQTLVNAGNNGTFDSIAVLANQLQGTQDMQSLDATLRNLRTGLDRAVGALNAIGMAPSSLAAKLAMAKDGADKLADGSRKIADGVKVLVDQTKRMGSGLNEASSFLLMMKHDAGNPSMAGFYVPPQIMSNDQFKTAAQLFISPDGHAARYFVQSSISPFSTAAMDQVDRILHAARSALPNTTLADATVGLSGIPTGLKDTRDYYNQDFSFIIVATIIIVLLILIALLRAVVAPLYLIASVIISYLSALGLGVVFFQLILGEELAWSVPGLTFILLVAVGADYNMLLISRIRDESPHGVRVGVIRTVGSTGGVITSAGLIFAASMFGLMFASISQMEQAGFIIGIGIMLDTFLVRTITVPAVAALVNKANWWPSKVGASDVNDSAADRIQVTARTIQSKARKMPTEVRTLIRGNLHHVHPGRRPITCPPSDARLPRRLDGAPKAATAAEIAEPIGHDSDHALPLFGFKTPQQRVTPDTQDRPADRAASADGASSTQNHPDNALPLFNLNGLPHNLAPNERPKPAGSATTAEGEPPANDNSEHALPLFGLGGLPAPVILGARKTPECGPHTNGNGDGHANGNGHIGNGHIGNGNGHANGHTNGNGNANGNGEMANQDLYQALPLFQAAGAPDVRHADSPEV